MNDSDLIVLMIQRAKEQDLVAEVTDSFINYRVKGEGVIEASRKALFDWNCDND